MYMQIKNVKGDAVINHPLNETTLIVEYTYVNILIDFL